MCPTSGLLADFATLMVVIVLTSSPRSSMVGSGQPIRLDSHPPTLPEPSMIGPSPEGKFIILVSQSG